MVATTPTVTANGGVDAVHVKEDGFIAVTIASALGAGASPDEFLTVTVSGISADWGFSAPVGSYDSLLGEWTVTLAAAQNLDTTLTFTPPADSDIDLSGLVATAISTDPVGANSSAPVTDLFNIIVDSVADKPQFVATGETVAGNQAANVTLSATLVDADGSETITGYRIAGVPTGFTFNHGTFLGGGMWSFTPAQISGLQIHSPVGFSGSLNLTATVLNSENPVSDGEFDFSDNNNNAMKSFTVTWDTNADVGGDLSVIINDGDGFINFAERSTVSYTIAGVDADALATVTFSDGNALHDIVVNNLGNGTQTIDLTSLDDGPITTTVHVTDAVGNTATGAGETSTMDTHALASIDIDNITADNVIDGAEAAGTVTITGTVGGDAKDGDTVTLTVKGKNYTGLVSAGAFAIGVSGSELVADSDHTVDAAVTATDAAGNSATATDTQSYGITLTGNNGPNLLIGGPGNDTLDGQGGIDVLLSFGGNDTLIGGKGNDLMLGGDGNDTFLYTVGDGADTINGGSGIDTLVITGTTGNNTIDVELKNDTITDVAGGSISGVEHVVLDMLAGSDTLSFAGTHQDITTNLSASTATGFDSISGVENVTGGSGDDTITGSTANNVLDGGSGNDLISGLDGNDTLIGGRGDDTLIGGPGNDTLNGGDGRDLLVGGVGADRIDVGSSNDNVQDIVRFTDASEFGDTVFDFDVTGSNLQVDKIQFTGALNTAYDDIVNDDQFSWVSGNGSNGGNTTANLNTTAEGLFLAGTHNEGVTNANLGNAAAVAAEFNSEFNIIASAGQNALLVINDTNANSFAVWAYIENGGTPEIQTNEIQLVGIFNGNGAASTGIFDLV